jgi:hypothetical protein
LALPILGEHSIYLDAYGFRNLEPELPVARAAPMSVEPRLYREAPNAPWVHVAVSADKDHSWPNVPFLWENLMTDPYVYIVEELEPLIGNLLHCFVGVAF